MPKRSRSSQAIDKHVGSRIRLRRLLIEMTQGALGKSLGLTFQQVQKYEKGVNRIGAGRLYEIGGILKVPIVYFFEGLDETESPAHTIAAEGTMADSRVIDFARLVEKSGDGVRIALVMQVARALLAGDGHVKHGRGKP